VTASLFDRRRLRELGIRMSLGVLCAALVSACSVVAPVTPSADPSASGSRPEPPNAATIWAFAGTILPPSDPNTYDNELIDAVQLRDGGWIVIRAEHPRRYLADPTAVGPLVRAPIGQLLRLDPQGAVVAREHGNEPFGLRRISVFEDAGTVVGEGPQVGNGTLHSFRLDTLDGIATQYTSCLPIDGRCWSYRSDTFHGPTALEEREPRTLAVLRTYEKLKLDGALSEPAIFPDRNLIAWQLSGPGRGLQVAPLDDASPIAIPWLAQLRTACSVDRIGADRTVLTYGPAGCSGETGWTVQLVEVSTGRIVRDFGSDAAIERGQRGLRVLLPSGASVRPSDGAAGPVFARAPVFIDWEKGVALVGLADGGGAVLRRQLGSPSSQFVPFKVAGSGRCPIDFPRVQRLAQDDPACPALSGIAGPDRLLIASGRGYFAPTDLIPSGVVADDAARTLTIEYEPTSNAKAVRGAAPARVIELGRSFSGTWLVTLRPVDGAGGSQENYFAVTFP